MIAFLESLTWQVHLVISMIIFLVGTAITVLLCVLTFRKIDREPIRPTESELRERNERNAYIAYVKPKKRDNSR